MCKDTDISERASDTSWRIHMPNLLEEALTNPGASALARPLNILGQKLCELAELAIEIDDPRLHLIMLDLALYSAGHPPETSLDEISKTRKELLRQISALQNSNMQGN